MQSFFLTAWKKLLAREEVQTTIEDSFRWLAFAEPEISLIFIIYQGAI